MPQLVLLDWFYTKDILMFQQIPSRCASTQISADSCATSDCGWRSATLPSSRACTKAHSYTGHKDGGCPGREEGSLSCGEAHTGTRREASSHHDREAHSRSGCEAVPH